ncbi:MAG: anti-repressor SinI family protein [Bacillaceae bacterium]|nr:anti-repressor SinI family protein [Bacillaceae bacterium]
MKPTELPCEERLLDLEWILLMKDAREIGLEPEDVKAFLEQCNGNQEGR